MPGQELIRLCQDIIEVVSNTLGDLTLPPGEKSRNLWALWLAEDQGSQG